MRAHLCIFPSQILQRLSEFVIALSILECDEFGVISGWRVGLEVIKVRFSFASTTRPSEWFWMKGTWNSV